MNKLKKQTTLETFGPLITNYTFTNLTSNTLYKLRLFTQSSSIPSFDFRDIPATTYPSRTFFFIFFFFLFFLFFFHFSFFSSFLMIVKINNKIK